MKSFNFLYQKREHKLIHIDEMYHKSKTEQSNKDNSDRNIQRITKAYNFTKIALLFSLWQGELINKLSHISANVEKISLHCCSVMARICCTKWHFCHSFVIQYIYIYILLKKGKRILRAVHTKVLAVEKLVTLKTKICYTHHDILHFHGSKWN